MAKNKTHTTPEEREDARKYVEALREAGVECTEREVFLAKYISNAVETIVVINSTSVDGAPPAHPELDTDGARRLYDRSGDDRYVGIRTMALARAIVMCSKMHLTDERRAGYLAKALVALDERAAREAAES